MAAETNAEMTVAGGLDANVAGCEVEVLCAWLSSLQPGSGSSLHPTSVVF